MIRKILWASILLLVSMQANAAIISYNFSGSLSTISDTGNLLGGAFSVGDVFNGSLSYESDSPDGAASSTYFTSSADVNIISYLNGYTFSSTASASVDLNSDPNLEYIYFISGYDSDPFIDLGSNSGRLMTLFLQDLAGSIFANDSLPTNLDLSDTASSTLTLHGDTGPGGFAFSLKGVLTSLTPSAVPEPTVLLLFLAGTLGLGLTRRKRINGSIS
jgi:hypothetical protein